MKHDSGSPSENSDQVEQQNIPLLIGQCTVKH